MSKYVSQICVYADTNRDYAIGIIVPSTEALMELARDKQLPADMKTLCQNEEIEKAIVEDLKAIGDSKKVTFYFCSEIIKKWIGSLF